MCQGCSAAARSHLRRSFRHQRGDGKFGRKSKIWATGFSSLTVHFLFLPLFSQKKRYGADCDISPRLQILTDMNSRRSLKLRSHIHAQVPSCTQYSTQEIATMTAQPHSRHIFPREAAFAEATRQGAGQWSCWAFAFPSAAWHGEDTGADVLIHLLMKSFSFAIFHAVFLFGVLLCLVCIVVTLTWFVVAYVFYSTAFPPYSSCPNLVGRPW